MLWLMSNIGNVLKELEGLAGVVQHAANYAVLPVLPPNMLIAQFCSILRYLRGVSSPTSSHVSRRELFKQPTFNHVGEGGKLSTTIR